MTRTTLEMMGIFTERDKADRFFVMKPCIDCQRYCKQDTREKDKPCIYCKGYLSKNGRYWFSLRTFPGERRFTAAQRRTLG